MAEPIAPGVRHRTIDVDTPGGPARAYVVDPSDRVAASAAGDSQDAAAPADAVAGDAPGQRPRGVLVLGHGAGKGTNTPDLWGLLSLAHAGWKVILVDQPWVLAGRRVATAPKKLDEAWLAVIDELRRRGELDSPVVTGGRSAGARVACRTATQIGTDAVVALAFPLMPPGKKNMPEKWRTHEAQNVVDAGIPLLVVQGARDTFGGPSEVAQHLPGADVVAVKGPHGFTAHPDDVVDAVREWLAALTT